VTDGFVIVKIVEIAIAGQEALGFSA